MSSYYGRDGKPITQEKWITDFSNNEIKRVAYDQITPIVGVSTVWLGLDHGYGESKLIFETMVFGGPLDGDGLRYTTEEEALAGHADMCKRAQAAHCDFGITP